MKCICSIGKLNKYYIYIIISFFCEFFLGLIFGLNNDNKDYPIRLFSFKPKLRKHNLLENFLRIAAIFFGGIILYIYERKNEVIKKDIVLNDDILEDDTLNEFEKDLNDKNKKTVILNLLIIGVLFSLYIILKDFINTMHTYVGFWSWEILYICIISRLIFKIKISKHKKLAMFVMIGITAFEIIEYCFPKTKHENPSNELTDKSVFDKIKIKFGTYIIPILFLVNELKHVQRDYCWIRSKYLMDIRLYSPSKIFLAIGTCGFIFIIIFFSICTYVPCNSFNNINKINNTYINISDSNPLKLYLEYCEVVDYDENTKTLKLFYDSIKVISNEYSNTDKENMLEIFLVIPLYFIFNLINEVSRLLLVRYTDSNNILIYKNLFYFINRIVVIIVNKGDQKYLTYPQFFLLQFEEVVSILSNLIYIEVLELRFCKLDYELKKNIEIRSQNDTKESSILIKKVNNDEDDNELESDN